VFRGGAFLDLEHRHLPAGKRHGHGEIDREGPGLELRAQFLEQRIDRGIRHGEDVTSAAATAAALSAT
jgi:hypothetical protein